MESVAVVALDIHKKFSKVVTMDAGARLTGEDKLSHADHAGTAHSVRVCRVAAVLCTGQLDPLSRVRIPGTTQFSPGISPRLRLRGAGMADPTTESGTGA